MKNYDTQFNFLLNKYKDNYSYLALLKEARRYHKGNMSRTLNYIAVMSPVIANQFWDSLILAGLDYNTYEGAR